VSVSAHTYAKEFAERIAKNESHEAQKPVVTADVAPQAVAVVVESSARVPEEHRHNTETES